MVETSTLISIIYFGANITLLLLLGYYVKKHGEYESIKSKAFIKDIWSQRKIYAPLIVHFYDTATDIGVILYWYGLMVEETDQGIDYESVNMKVFFWCGITFLLFYRLCTLIFVTASVCNCDPFDIESDWYDVMLVVLDVYIFKTVYQSFKDANNTLGANAKRRKEREAKKKQMELEITSHSEETETEKKKVTETPDDEDEIAIHDTQMILQMGESITESMPLISIANKFVRLDSDKFKNEAQELSAKWKFPGCVSYWYILGVLWRICNVMSQFIIYVLIWTVLGGAWIGIWCAFVYILYVIYLTSRGLSGCEDFVWTLGYGFVAFAGLLLDLNHDAQHVMKFMESCVGLSVIAIFATMGFECGICASSDQRQFVNDAENNRILMYFVMGCASAIMEAILYIILRCGDMVDVDDFKL